MAERRGPTDGKRFTRAAPTRGNTKKQPNGKTPSKPLDTYNGETKCTPEMIDRIVKLIRAGNYAQIAAACVGIASSTFYEWLTRGGRGEEPYRALAEAVEKAKAEDEAGTTAEIRRHGQTHWQALAWMQERKYNKRWGRRDSLEITGDEDRPVHMNTKIDLSKLSTEELRMLKTLREKARVETDDEPE